MTMVTQSFLCLSFAAVRKSPARRTRLGSADVLSPPHQVTTESVDDEDKLSMFS